MRLALTAILKHYRSSEGKQDADKAKSELKLIELENARIEQKKALGELCRLKDADAGRREYLTFIRQAISSELTLGEIQKKKLLTKLAALPFELPEPAD